MAGDFRVRDRGDGTWEVREFHPNTGQSLNGEWFPSEQEARWYADERNGGALHVGALMAVHEKRVAQSQGLSPSGSVLRRFPYRGHYSVTGRGVAYSFLPEDLPVDLVHPRELVGSEIGIGEVRVRVVGVEHWAIECPRDGGRCGHSFSLLVTW